MKLKDGGDVELSESRGIKCLDHRYEVRLLGQSINHHQKCIKAMRRREICDEVHRNRLPISTWDFKGIKVTVRSMPSSLVPLTEVT